MDMNRDQALHKLSSEAQTLRRRFGVKDLAVFGSVARNEAHPRSDLDLLVTFEGRADFDRFMNLKFHLEDLLGLSVDLVTPNALRPELRARIEQEAVHVP